MKTSQKKKKEKKEERKNSLRPNDSQLLLRFPRANLYIY